MIDESIEKEYGNRLRVRVAGICIKKNSILLINHSGLNSQNEFWAPPGGGLNYKESAIECLQREFLEETGLDIVVNQFLKLNEYINPPLHALELFFYVSIIEGSILTGFDPEVSAENQIIKQVKFMSIVELRKIPDSNKHSIFHGLKKIEDLTNETGYFKFPRS